MRFLEWARCCIAPQESGLPQSTKQLGFVLAKDRSAAQIAAQCHIPTVTANVEVQELKGQEVDSTSQIRDEKDKAERLPAPDAASASATESESDHKAPASLAATEDTLRVDAKRIDNVLNLVGELIIGKSMLQQILVEFTRRYPKDPLRGRLADSLAFQSRILNDLQHSVMKVRMMPVEQLFRRFPRIVRDISRQCGKQAELAVSGEDTDLDRSLLDTIAEPLTHLIRNAVSHGLETADERVRAGKPACGTVGLKAYHQGNQVIIEVSDDGRGIDLQRVKAKAIEQQLLAMEQSLALSETEILALVFRPGFSTAQRDQRNFRAWGRVGYRSSSVLQRLKGAVEIVNRPGHGHHLSPETSPHPGHHQDALLFRVEKRLYAIPLNAVDEIARARESDLHHVDEREVMQLRGQALQLVRLGRVRTGDSKHPRAKFSSWSSPRATANWD